MARADGFEGYLVAVFGGGVAVRRGGAGVGTPFEAGGAGVGLECFLPFGEGDGEG